MTEMSETDAQSLAKQLDQFTILSLRNDELIGVQNGMNLSDLPAEVLVAIFSNVGSNSTNPPPTEHFMDYLAARDTENYEHRISNQRINITEKSEWEAKSKEEYAVRNLMTLRRVCSKFEDVINNMMIPGADFDFLMIDVKIQSCRDCPRSVVVFKYGGNGSQNPCTRLRRIRRYNEVEFEHIQKFERIRNLYISDMVLTEELFETILRLDLTETKKITFERVLDVNFNESINIVNYIQNFLNTLNSPANVFFNSEVFDPNSVLFGSNDIDDQMDGIQDPEILSVFEGLRKNPQRHKQLRFSRRKTSEAVKEFRRYRAINVVNNILHSKQYYPKEATGRRNYTETRKREYRNELMKEYDNLTKYKGIELRKAGKWHLKKIFEALEDQPVKGRKSLIYHLKMLKKIPGVSPLVTADEELTITRQWNERRQREHLLQQFPFLEKIQLKSRLYAARRDINLDFKNLSLV